MSFEGEERTSALQNHEPLQAPSWNRAALTAAFVLGLYLFLLALDGFTTSWRLLFSVEAARELVVENVNSMLDKPLLGFFLGLLITSLVQSSSATVVLIISYVATQNAPVSLCIPVILGANIGTTVTNTLVALGHSFSKEEFERVVPAALVDDLFKVLNVSGFFVLEVWFGFLTWVSDSTVAVLNRFIDGGGNDPLLPDFVGLLTDGPIAWWETLVGALGSGVLPAIISGGVAFVLLLTGLKLMGTALSHLFATGIKRQVRRSLKSPARGAAIGCVICWVLQSSSVTTSLMMPLVAHGIATLRHAYYFAVGAAVGTTIDSGQILAYLKYGTAGLVAGIVHITVNVIGASLFLFVPSLRDVPIHLAERLGRWLGSSRWAPIRFAVLVAAAFYVVPLVLITAL